MTTFERKPHDVLSLNQSPEELTNVYDVDYYDYLASPQFRHAFLEPLAERINSYKLPVLDVGCGEGNLAQYISVPYYGFDGSDTAIQKAIEKNWSGPEKAAYPESKNPKGIKKFCVARLETFNEQEFNFGTIVFGGILKVLVKAEQRIPLLNQYIKRFDPKYILIYDLEELDHEPISNEFKLIDEYHATADVPGLQEIKKHRKILTYQMK